MDQLVRETPPGFGGIERVAHTIAIQNNGIVYCLRPDSHTFQALPVNYIRKSIFSFALGRLILPFPSIPLLKLLISNRPLLAHLPCPTVLFIAWLAHCLRPQRKIIFYWHAFIDPREGLLGFCENIYQAIALKVIRNFLIISTSPILKAVLLENKIPARNIQYLPCSLTSYSEILHKSIWEKRQKYHELNGTLIVICRLDSYKRVDWLIQVFPLISSARRLIVVGDGPDRTELEALANDCLRDDQEVKFYGLVDENSKLDLLSEADVLILPSNRCNEAFGIVQLEAMASGIPSLAFSHPRSGMHWVSNLPGLGWNGYPDELPALIEKLLIDASLYKWASTQSRKRYEEEFSTTLWIERLASLEQDYAQS